MVPLTGPCPQCPTTCGTILCPPCPWGSPTCSTTLCRALSSLTYLFLNTRIWSLFSFHHEDVRPGDGCPACLKSRDLVHVEHESSQQLQGCAASPPRPPDTLFPWCCGELLSSSSHSLAAFLCLLISPCPGTYMPAPAQGHASSLCYGLSFFTARDATCTSILLFQPECVLRGSREVSVLCIPRVL